MNFDKVLLVLQNFPFVSYESKWGRTLAPISY